MDSDQAEKLKALLIKRRAEHEKAMKIPRTWSEEELRRLIKEVTSIPDTYL